MDQNNSTQRLAKAIAQAGVCSRRDAEKLILESKVRVNGTLIQTPATLVNPDDQIYIQDQLLPQIPEVKLWRFYKPSGIITTHKDPQGRKTVFEILPQNLQRVISVGRLDLMSEGLLLLTNQGHFARQLELPNTALKRVYHVRIFGQISNQHLKSLKAGIEIEGIFYGRIEAHVLRQNASNCWIQVTLVEGKNREIRRIFNYLGYQINRLIRVQYGLFKLLDLQPGAVQEVPSEMLNMFQKQLAQKNKP